MSETGKASALLDEIGGCGPIDLPIALVVAHPDDEAIAAAGLMVRLRRLTLIHVTDGGSGGRGDASGHVRSAELTAALAAMLARPVKTSCYGLIDGSVVDRLPDLVHRLVADLAHCDIVLTHPYEGGHVDHDACAFAVWQACRVIAGAGGTTPERVEFTSYHRRRGSVRAGEFWPDARCPALRVDLAPDAVQRRVSAFACHRSQEMNLRFFPTNRETFRVAPEYDFASLPPPRLTLYGAAAEAVLSKSFRALLS